MFFKSKMGCKDPNCGFAHVVRMGPSMRPRKSARDACKITLREAFHLQAWPRLFEPPGTEDERQQRLALQHLAASEPYAFNLVLGQIDRPGSPEDGLLAAVP